MCVGDWGSARKVKIGAAVHQKGPSREQADARIVNTRSDPCICRWYMTSLLLCCLTPENCDATSVTPHSTAVPCRGTEHTGRLNCGENSYLVRIRIMLAPGGSQLTVSSSQSDISKSQL